jgi:hypothetical protein
MGNLYITEEHRVRKIAVDGTVTVVAGRKSNNSHKDGSKYNFYIFNLRNFYDRD